MGITREQLKALLREGLSPREITVARLVAIGYTTREAARILELEPESVHTYRKHLYKKLDVHCVAELTIWALDRGLVCPEEIWYLQFPPEEGKDQIVELEAG